MKTEFKVGDVCLIKAISKNGRHSFMKNDVVVIDAQYAIGGYRVLSRTGVQAGRVTKAEIKHLDLQ